MPVVLDVPGGHPILLPGPERGVYWPLPVEVYRRHAWMGLFRRRLVRVRQYGCSFWRDVLWERRQRVRASMGLTYTDTTGAVVVGRPEPKRSGCGCGGRVA